jgi:hypothetical protein
VPTGTERRRESGRQHPQTSHHDRKDKAMTVDDRNRATVTVEDDGHEPADDT